MYNDYDINFHFPVKPLESDRVRLVPFHVSTTIEPQSGKDDQLRLL